VSTRGRRWLLAVLALALVAGVGIVAFLVFAEDELEAARRRVPRGADREAVEAAVGRPADGRTARTAFPDDPRRVLIWLDGKHQLLVEFNADGRAVEAWTYHPRGPTLWERFRAWLGW
jgi:hypothetical protein